MKKILALALAALTLAALATGCNKNEYGDPASGPVNIEGTYVENIPEYTTGDPAIDEDFQKQLKDLSKRLEEAHMPAYGDYEFRPDIQKFETDKYLSLVANAGDGDKDNYYGFVYDKRSQAPVQLEDVLSAQDVANLPALVAEGMKLNPALTDGDTSTSLFTENVRNPSGFALEQDKLILFYPVAYILPAMYETPVVEVPLTLLKEPIK